MCLSRKYVIVGSDLMPAQVALFIVRRDAVANGLDIQHVAPLGAHIDFALWEWTGKALTGRTVSMNTSCYLLGIEPCFGTGKGSPLGKYCRFCGSAITSHPMHALWDSSSDTTSLVGSPSFPSDRLIFSSLVQESRNGLVSAVAPAMFSPIRWYGKDGNSIFSLAAASSFVRTRAAVLSSLLRVETALAVAAWNIHSGTSAKTVLGLYQRES